LDWTRLSREEADRLALAQEHDGTAACVVSPRRPARGEVLRHSLAWIAVWVVTGFVIWAATPS
jgi:hypothetical protein